MNSYMQKMSLNRETSLIYSHNNQTVHQITTGQNKGCLGFFLQIWRVIDLTFCETMGDLERIFRLFSLKKEDWTPADQSIPAALAFSALHFTQKIHEGIFLLCRLAIRIGNIVPRLILHLGYVLFCNKKLKSFEHSYPKNFKETEEDKGVVIRERRSHIYAHMQSIKLAENSADHPIIDVVNHVIIDYASDQIEALYSLINAVVCVAGLIFHVFDFDFAKKCTLKNTLKSLEDAQIYQAKTMIDIFILNGMC